MAGLLHLALTKCSRVRQFGASIRSHDIIEVNTTRSAQSLESEIAILRDRFELLEAVTDELLLAVPSYPRHAECALPGATSGSDDN